MKKIMFNEPYGMQSDTLEGKKVRTTRNEFGRSAESKLFALMLEEGAFKMLSFDGENQFKLSCNNGNTLKFKTKYSVGETIAVAQRYREIKELTSSDKFECVAGWNNKMFVRPNLMPHRIKITDIKIEQLQDISDGDCIKEGVTISDYCNPEENGGIQYDEKFIRYAIRMQLKNGNGYYEIKEKSDKNCADIFTTPRKAFAYLIDGVSGKGTWKRNGFNVVYYYKLTR